MAEPDLIVEPADVPRPPVSGRGVTATWLSLLEVVLCSGFPTQLGLSLLLLLAGFNPAVGDELSFGFVVALSMLDTAAIVALVVVFLRARGESFRITLIGSRPLGDEFWRGVRLLPLIFVVVFAGGQVIEWLAPQLHNVTLNPLQAMLDSPVKLALFAVVVVVAGGVREEVQRGFILHRFDHDLGGRWVGLFLFSVMFGLGHTVQGFDAAIITGVLGFVWGLVFLARRSIVAPVVSHALFNLSELAIFYYASRAGLVGS